tara:strand:+ start:384 stop:1391 length:1008 start_codon:yes stop_codon:yes gene_type:complete
MKRKARDTSINAGITPIEKIKLDSREREFNGVRDKKIYESTANVLLPKGAVGQGGLNNTGIWQSTDYIGHFGSGLGARNDSGQIDIVAGYSSALSNKRTKEINPQDPERIELVDVYPSAFNDASRIKLNIKTNVDDDFQLAEGNIGSVMERAAIAVKSDSVRVIGREGIKIITGVTEEEPNSAGGPIRSIPRINLIAGNADTPKGKRAALEPLAKADTLRLVIEDIYNQINVLNSVLDTFMNTQIEFNTQAIFHQHPDIALMGCGLAAESNPLAINNGKCPPSAEMLSAGVKFCSVAPVAKYDAVMQKLQTAIEKINNTNPAGPKNFASPGVYTT